MFIFLLLATTFLEQVIQSIFILVILLTESKIIKIMMCVLSITNV